MRQFRIPFYLCVNLCVENKLALASRSQHFPLFHWSHAEKLEVARVLRSITTTAMLAWK